MNLPTLIHVLSASAALALGAWQLLAPRTGERHRVVGYLWMGSMLTAAVSSFWLRGALGFAWLGGFGPIHALSLFTLLSIALAVRFAIRRDFRQHRRWVTGAYGGLVAAGVFAVAVPGRAMHELLASGLPRVLAGDLTHLLATEAPRWLAAFN